MAFNTGNPIGSTDARDLSDNAQNFDEAINDRSNQTWTDRLGVGRKTVWGAFSEITYKAPVAYVSGISFLTTDANKTVEQAGVVYAPLNSALPFTTSGTFVGGDDARFYPLQDKNNVIRATSIADIESYSAPVGYIFNLNAGGRSGVFDVVSGDFSAEVAIDTARGIYVPLADNPTGSTKVAKRRFDDFCHVRWFGANFDGTDETALVNMAIDLEDRILLSGGGTLGISAAGPSTGIICRDNLTVAFVKGTKIQAITGNTDEYFIFRAVAVDNVAIINPHIIGDRATNTSPTGEKGHLIFVYQSSNVKVIGIHQGILKDAFGDGLYIGGDTTECTDCFVSGILCDNNRRQGLSITAAKNLTVRDSAFNNTNGTAPEFGIDVEPNNSDVKLQNILFDGCSAGLNAGANFGVLALNQDSSVDVTFSNCVGFGLSGFLVKDCSGTGSINFIGCDTHGATRQSLLVDNVSLPVLGKITANAPVPPDIINSFDGSVCVLGAPVSNIDIEIAVFVDNPNSPAIKSALFLVNDSGTVSGKVHVSGNIKQPVVYLKSSTVDVDLNFRTSVPMELNRTASLTNANFRSVPAWYTIITNTGAVASTFHQLSTEANFEGHRISARITASQTIGFDLFGGAVVLPGSGSSVSSNTLGSSIEMQYDGTNWIILKQVGTWNVS